MPLPVATRFGPFEITGLLGAGGMGEVYRARDTRLDRDVALKVLPADLTGDPDRVARFEREAKTLASLNHPHIAHVYGLEDASAPVASAPPARALVMELVEGQDLAQCIASRPMPVADVVSIARQIADAITCAHDNGIVHRDLKPANIRITSDGTVKVLDFGLAKTLQPDSAGRGAAQTTTDAGTVGGAIMGTAPYMSPEQARGLPVDGRTDVWAFGCVLYEMLTGQQAFPGPTPSDTIARILEREPDWGVLPASTPPSVRRLLTRCLEKDPKRRLRVLADAHFELDDALAESKGTAAAPADLSPLPARRWAVVAGAVALLAAVALWKFFPWTTATVSPPRVMPLTSHPGIEAAPSFSPDGNQVAFSWEGETRDNEDIWVLVVGSESPVRFTTNPARDVSPAWSPNGAQIAFARVGESRVAIYVVSALGQSEQKLAEFAGVSLRAAAPGAYAPLLSWSSDGRWLAVAGVSAAQERGIFLLSHDGGTRALLVPAKDPIGHTALGFSPGGEALAYADSGYIEVARINLTSPPTIRTPPKRVTSFLGTVNGLTWTANGRELVFGRSEFFAPSASYLWRTPADGGKAPERMDLAGVGSFPALSSSGDRLAYSRRTFNVDMFLLEEARAPQMILASTFNEFDASFSPDGSKVAFSSDRNGEGNEIFVANAADGSSRRSPTKGLRKPEGSPRWSPDGRRLAFDGLGEDGHRHVYVVDETGGPIQTMPSVAGSYDQVPSWSRDGKWIYFGSNRSGRMECWRAPAAGGAAEQITRTGGSVPFESDDGRTLYYLRAVDGLDRAFALPLDGGAEQPLDVATLFSNYLPAAGGIYYSTPRQGQRPPFTYEVRFLDLAEGKSRILHSLRLAHMAPGLSVRADGKTILVAGVPEITQDLMRIENFR